MNTDKAIIDLTDEELDEFIRHGANYPDRRQEARSERDYRSQNKNTKALNRWTVVIALATLLNAIAMVASVIIAFLLLRRT